MPTIRTVRPTDLISLISFFRDGSHREVTAQVWPEVLDGAGKQAIWSLVLRSIARPGGGTQVWVYLARDGVRGLAIAHPRAGKLAWDVRDLFVVDGDRSAAIDLLDRLSSEAAGRGARRVFLATPVDVELARIANRAGFVNYTSETLHSIRLTAPLAGTDSRPARPRLRQDTHGLFQLYNAAVPCRVRMAEAMTVDEWSALERGGKPWAPSLGGSRQHFVWDDGDGPVGWLQISFGARSQHLEMLVHPSHRGETEELVLASLSQMSHRAPIYVSTREYQIEIATVLEELGFSRVADYLIFVRELAARVPSRAMVPARA